MKKTKNLGFFRKIILSITDFRLFPYIIRHEGALRSFMHFIGFILLIVFIISIKFYNVTSNIINNIIANYDENVPEFTLNDGVLQVSNNEIIRIDTDMGISINTAYDYENYKESDDYNQITKYNIRFLVNSDSITFERYDGIGIQIQFKDVSENYNKESFYTFITSWYNKTSSKFLIMSVVYSTLLASYGLSKLLDIILFSIFVCIVCLLNRMKMDYKNYFKIAIYAITLPLIIEAISVFYTGMLLKDYVIIVSNLLTLVYIFYGVRAVKLDAFLLILTNSSKAKQAGKTNKYVININDQENDNKSTDEAMHSEKADEEEHKIQEDNHNEEDDQNQDEK